MPFPIVLLFLFADLDLYALTDPRQFYDREAQMHKLIALILAGVGIRALTRKHGVVVGQAARLPREANGNRAGCPTNAEQHRQFQNRLIALRALVGGALLFTHIHTVAPYADVAAGVYINHIVMGFVALAIGGVKLLEDAHSNPHPDPLPRRERGQLLETSSPRESGERIEVRGSRAALWRTLLFPSLLVVQSFLLLTYTEGIPWWAGIGHYNRWGPNGGTIAPFGQVRAQLLYDAEIAQMDACVLERFSDNPVRVRASNLDVIISQRYQETAGPLVAVDSTNEGGSHFRREAAFLKEANQFDARINLPLGGKWRTGYFDPWVVPAIVGIPPNQVARFVCPMHDGIRSTAPGDCKLCGMPLVPIRTKLTSDLHDAKYAMRLVVGRLPSGGASAPTPRDLTRPTAGQPTTLCFIPQYAATGEIVRDLLVVHKYLLHLIVTSDDLSYFDHVHPVQQPDGTFAIDYTFPHGGNFLLFADVTPRGERAQVFRLPIEVGRDAQIGFRLSQHGKPVTDL